MIPKFCFPSKFPTYRNKKSDFQWYSVGLSLPYVFFGTETVFCDVNEVWKLHAPTEIKFQRNEYWHSFSVLFLGFGVIYARQWNY